MGFGLRFFYVGLPMGLLVVPSCGSYSGYFGEFRVEVQVVMVWVLGGGAWLENGNGHY